MENGEGGQNITPQHRLLHSSKTVSWSESVGFFLTREGFHKLNSRIKRFPLLKFRRKNEMLKYHDLCPHLGSQ